MPTVTIASPLNGARVDTTTTVKGSSQHIPEGSTIWLVVFLPTVRRYYPQDSAADVQVNGEWSSVATIGQEKEAGLNADVLAIAANKSVQYQFNTYLVDARGKSNFAGMERLPDGASILDRVSLIRR